LRRFLVGVDFSDRSSRAEDQALRIASRTGASLSAVHVIDGDAPPRLAAAAVDEARDRAAVFAGRGAAAGVDCRLTTARGETHVELPRLARESEAACLVLGSHRKSPERNAFVGTTADRILRASGVPVLVVRSETPHDYRAALAAIDLSSPDFRPLSAALDLGLVAADKVTVVFGAETETMRRLRLDAASLDALARAFEADEATLRSKAQELVENAGLPGVKVAVRPVLLNAADFVLKTAGETGADLVVLGSKRKNADHRQPLGSVSESVLRRADIDVLVVPAA
jgi:nucleotide-binding universal stress UspA family protein